MIHNLMKPAKILILQSILPSGSYVYPHTSLVMKHFLFPYNVPIIIKPTSVLITAQVEGINISDQGIVSFTKVWLV